MPDLDQGRDTLDYATPVQTPRGGQFGSKMLRIGRRLCFVIGRLVGPVPRVVWSRR